MVTRWVFEDPYDSETETVEINPVQATSPSLTRNVASMTTSGPNPRRILFEGRPSPKRMTFSGAVRTQSHYDMLKSWRDKRRQVKLTDDLGRTFWIYITDLSYVNGERNSVVWRHEYEIEAIVLSEV